MTDYILFNDTTVSRSISKEVKMKKILVFICLMVLSSSVFSLGTSVEMYKNWKEDARENGHIEFFYEAWFREYTKD